MHPAPHHHQKESPCEAIMCQDRAHGSSTTQQCGPPLKRSPPMKSIRTQTMFFEWTWAIDPKLSSHQQESAIWSGPNAPEPPIHWKPQIWRIAHVWQRWWMRGRLQVSPGGYQLKPKQIVGLRSKQNWIPRQPEEHDRPLAQKALSSASALLAASSLAVEVHNFEEWN
jgi:hypothetical protein